MKKPQYKPEDPRFSSGPCKKHPGWTLSALATDCLGRKHRADIARASLRRAIDRSAALLQLPSDWQLAIIPGSATGSFELALWNMLGQRAVDIFAWESFANYWAEDIQQLGLQSVCLYTAAHGEIADLKQANPTHDCVFVYNGTTSGVCVPDLDWIAADRQGIVLCDATSAVFAMPIDYQKLDVVTWSWQKCLGGEAGFGMLALSPRAIERLQNYRPTRPIPKLFQIIKTGKIYADLFTGATLNTISLLAVADLHSSLDWAEQIGGLQKLIALSQQNFQVIDRWIAGSAWADWVPHIAQTRSNTSMCVKVITPAFNALNETQQWAAINQMCQWLEAEEAAYDIAAYRKAAPGFRIWGGPTVAATDLEKLLPWLDWAYQRWEQQHQH